MKFKKYICIRYHHLSKKSFKEYYLQEVKERGIEVEYWDTVYVFFKDDYRQEDSSNLAYTRRFFNFQELEQAIAEQHVEDTLFVTTSTFEYKVRKLHLLFKRYNCIVAGFGRNMFPLVSDGKWSRLKRVTPKKVIHYFQRKNLIDEVNRHKVKAFDIVFLAGMAGWQGLGQLTQENLKGVKFIPINSCDYDDCLENNESERLLPYEYILFLDQYLPLHPDWQMFHVKTVSVENYYKDINKYFSDLEKKTGLKVVIAAHPKALKYREKNYFDNRLVLFDCTRQLVKYASVVLAHNSVSVNYPIIYNIPIHFITSREIEKRVNIVHRDVLNFAENIGAGWSYFDENSCIEINRNIDQEKYNNYKFLYQTSVESMNKLTKDIFIDFILEGK